jgi:HEPN domain-containing protein
MNPMTGEWIEKAEGDFSIARRELRARKAPNYDGVCFHAQQCAEKYFKARLHDAGKRIPKTHDLDVLLNLSLPLEPTWQLLRPAAQLLSDYAVRFRYPGATADRGKAREAMAACKLVRETARQTFGLPAETRQRRAAARRRS